jgi:hypothetical protein
LEIQRSEPFLEYFERVRERTRRVILCVPPEHLEWSHQRRCETPGGARLAAWKWLRSMAEHEIHHRGQIYLMLGMLEIPTPPLYGLTSEEVHSRSLQGG